MIVNLTPHPIKLYPNSTPDRIDPRDHEPELVLPATGAAPRISETSLGVNDLNGCPVPVTDIRYGRVVGLPPFVRDDPPTWYVVSLTTALAARRDAPRSDLLVPYRVVRDLDGTVAGCRGLARPM